MISFQILTFSLRGVGESKQKNFKCERFAMIFLTPPPQPPFEHFQFEGAAVF